ncbi:membrane protein, conserved [Thermococcus sp. 4557]|uniref:ABC transporter permease subunit n=1 Tax=Thermococcus sp. (strain CGMCC 1.5172 / 4557) TaxID=1042877 RepID=UPI000219E79A|nr:ABC transporter permease subunit [Thermococcus sp. 4557]AEK72556.1 membrane protein, conserved [Thermococcus sp. 4557]
MFWGFQLEFKQSLRTKKLWVILGVMMLLYLPGFYLQKASGEEIETVQQAVSVLISNVNGLGGFFIAILALLMGATAINSEIEKGTLRVAMSKPIKRLGYIGGKFLAHTVVVLMALLLTTLVGIVGLAWLGAPMGSQLVTDSLLLNGLLLLAMVQLIALGYIISTTVKSSSTALGVALIIMFVVFMIMPAIVQFMAAKDTLLSDHPDWEAYQEKSKEYKTRYLFYVPTTQIDVIVSDATKVTGDIENPQVEYVGIGGAIRKNPVNLGILLGLTFVYLALAFYRFLRMDLR